MTVTRPIPHKSPPFVEPADRRAAWLLCAYANDQWTVGDEKHGAPLTIDFRYRMPDGRPLCEWTDLYQSVKEYAWWVRDETYGFISDATTHGSRVLALMAIAHAFAYEGLASFDAVLPIHIAGILHRSVGGTEAIVHGRARILAHLAAIAAAEPSDTPYGGLPRYIKPDGAVTDRIASGVIMACANLPHAVLRIDRVTQPIAVAASKVGLRYEGPLAEPPEKQLTAAAMTRFLEPLEQMYALRTRMRASNLRFDPFPDGVQAAARPLGKALKRVPTPSPAAALGLLQQAVVWVIDYGPSILTFEEACHAARTRSRNPGDRYRRLIRVQSRLPDAGPPGSPWPCLVRREGHDKTFTLYTAVKYLAAACWIVIAAFSARRSIEIKRLDVGCLHGSDDEGWWLTAYIAKTLQRYEAIPVPHVVARAIELLTKLSRRARSSDRSMSLFHWTSPFTSADAPECIHLNPSATINAFAKHVAVAMSPSSRESIQGWHWTSHQFRRFFAILYFYIYDDASLEVLSHHLRHFSLSMTRVYITRDPEQQPFWLDAEWAYRSDLARAIIANERNVGGPMGTRLTKIARRITDSLRKRLMVVAPDRVRAHIEKVMRRTGLVLTPKPWVTCACPSSRAGAAAARCRMGHVISDDAIGPDPARAGPDMCANCPWALTTPASRARVRTERQALGEFVRTHAEGTSIVEMLARERLAELVSADAWGEPDEA